MNAGSAGRKPKIVLVRGVVYELLDASPFPITKPRPRYYRRSVPPDAVPGRRSRWPAAYLPDRLPDHEVIGEVRAREVIDASITRWRDVFAAARNNPTP